MKHLRIAPKKRLLTSALLLALAPPVVAQVAEDTQDAPPASQSQTGEASELDTVVVTGIRGSLDASMNLKRDAQGIVDGIMAEDIGKFPDTNLAESLQRISGVSIDRSLGEGSKVTVRGIGPDFNLVLLNGRQMPASGLGGGGADIYNSRGFDFANLASEAIAGVEVYKTSRASTPAGGIGASINIKTARPLDNPGFLANVGLKAVHDTSVDNMPDAYPGSKFTPEVSGIFSNTSADGRFGIALTASYQERDFGYSQAAVPNGWRAFRGDDDGWGSLAQTGPDAGLITNRPQGDELYSRPQNFNYNVNGVQRQRTNGQLTLQWAPSDRVTTTLDYTYSENKIQQQRNELSVWFPYNAGASSWTDGPVVGPIIYSENLLNSDIAMGGANIATKNENKSLGFNVEWEVTDRLSLEFDAHKSKAESMPDSPWGSAGVLGAVVNRRGNTTVDFSSPFPILTIQLPEGYQISAADAIVSGSVFHHARTRSEVEQAQVHGKFEFGDYSSLNFGVAATNVDNYTAHGYHQQDNWGGMGTPADYADDIWYADDMARYFGSFSGRNDPRLTGQFLMFDFDRLRARAAEVWQSAYGGNPNMFAAPTDRFQTELGTVEKSKSAYFQFNTTWDLPMPIHAAAGVRYERTEINSPSLVTVPAQSGIEWGSANEFNVVFGTEQQSADFHGKYNYWLPSLDVAVELTDNMILRSSVGKTIGRQGWNDIKGGLNISQQLGVAGGGGSRGNPGLLPLESKNFDLSFEWYYAPSSYFSAGYFRKNVKNFKGDRFSTETPYNLNTPVGGTYWNNAISLGGCGATEVVCIRDYILLNHDGDPGVRRTGVNEAGEQTGVITGLPTDPIAVFNVTVPTNERSDSIDGWEFNLQHMFGESGFGMQANYTIVDSGLVFDNFSLDVQYPMLGLSDSANLVAFFEKNAWQVRAAYNWRDKFLSGIGDGTGGQANPNYVESYGQLDLSVSYQFNERLTLQAEAINLTDETQRVHGRHVNQLRFLTQGGPRYMFGLRYKF